MTDEQERILASEGDLIINAVAGSGKTSTLVEIAKRNQNKKILYLAFNKSVKAEAIEKFRKMGLPHVKVATAHSLAFGRVFAGRQPKIGNGYSAFEAKNILNFKTKDIITDMKMGKHVVSLMNCFLNSRHSKVAEVDYLSFINNPSEKEFVSGHFDDLIQGVRMLLKKMQDGDVDMIHDFYLKQFQLAKPRLKYDLILFDEGQDASGVMLDTFLDQKARKIIVGDEHQQIYRWRYAINALRKVDFSRMSLTRSFRFPEVNADLATQILNTKQHLTKGLGGSNVPKIIGCGKEIDQVETKAILGRSNSALIVKAIEEAIEERNISRLYFEGNFSSYTYADEGGSIYDVLNLYLGKRRIIRDPQIKSFQDFAQLEEYAEAIEDAPLKGNIDMVKKYKAELPRLIKKIKEYQVADDERLNAEYIFSTVHRAKGMEYDEVTLLADFLGEDRLVSQIKNADEVNWLGLEEEVNILYVAATRSRSDLNIPSELIPDSFRGQSSRIKSMDSQIEEEIRFDKEPVDLTSALKAYTVEEVRKSHTSAYAKWTPELDRELLEKADKGLSTSDMATHFGRTRGAIRSRLKKLREDEQA